MIHVVLVEPEIHWNSGNAGRSCLAFGAQLHLVRPLGFSLSSKEIRRAGLDYWEHVAPVVWNGWDEFVLRLPELGTPWLFSTKGVNELPDAAFTGNDVLIFGSETRGLRAELLQEFSAQTVKIPMRGEHVRSLNLSTAVGIGLYAATRR